jgi:hypothetical protein
MKAQKSEFRKDVTRFLSPESISAGPMTTCTGTYDRTDREIFVTRGLPAQLKRERPSSQAHHAGN